MHPADRMHFNEHCLSVWVFSSGKLAIAWEFNLVTGGTFPFLSCCCYLLDNSFTMLWTCFISKCSLSKTFFVPTHAQKASSCSELLLPSVNLTRWASELYQLRLSFLELSRILKIL
jgi:hypothetical protein